MVSTILRQAWQVYRTHFGVIAAAVVMIWLPLELLISYLDCFVFGPDEFRKSFKLSQFLHNFVGIIATAAVIAIGYSVCVGEPPTLGGALGIGVRSWGRLWWTRLLTGLSLLIGFICLVVPGVYLLVRLALVEPIAVCEQISGPAAMRRSFALTRGRFWLVFRLGLAFGALGIAAIACVFLPVVFIPALDHWLIDAAVSLVADIVTAFGTLCLLCTYCSFSAEPGGLCRRDTATFARAD